MVYAYGDLVKLGGFNYLERLETNESFKRNSPPQSLYYPCVDEKIGFKYDSWCLGLFIKELWTRIFPQNADDDKFDLPSIPLKRVFMQYAFLLLF